jgi:MFS family permease
MEPSSLRYTLPLYFFSIFCLSVVLGIQIVAIPWLAVDYLALSPKAVGFIQAALLLPNVLLLVVGGISADRGDLVTKFLVLLGFYAAVHLGLLALLAQHWLSFFSLFMYALMLGVVGAFLQPSKDHLLGSLAVDELQTTIAKYSLCQYLGQALGIGLATPLYGWNLLSLPLVQLLFVVCALGGLLLFKRWHRMSLVDSNTARPVDTLSLQLLGSGFTHCWQSPVLRSLLIIVAGNGFFHVGAFIVALPLLAKIIYAGDIGFYSVLQCLFVAGTVATTVIVILKGPLDAPGRRVIFCVLYAGLILLGLSAGPTPYGLLLLIFLWGVVVGVSATLGRAILQSQTTAEYRGRAISIYQLALFGCAPLGSLFAGFVIHSEGVLYLLKLCAYASFILFAALFFTRALWDLETEHTQSAK